MKPSFIPCVTGMKFIPDYDVHLISPSERIKFVKAKKQTIVDCLTFGLKMDRGKYLNPYKHYLWYIDFVKEYQNENDIVFIVPDCDWLGEEFTFKIAEKWLCNINTKNCLIIPNTYLFGKVEIMGYALPGKISGPVHPKWTHSFSQNYLPISDETERWTFDSTNKEYS